MTATLQPRIERILDRVRQTGYPEYPWWIPVGSQLFTIFVVLVAIGQRWGHHPMSLALLLGGITLAPWLVESTGRHVVWPVYAALTAGGSLALTLLQPVDFDIAPLVWAMLAGKFGATERPSRSIPATASVGLAVIGLGVAGEVEGAGFWLLVLIIGWDLGFVMQYQQRKIEAQQLRQAENEARAVLEERQRIAREVHDVIAHSLSVTMLHLTAARRELEEDGSDGIPEAIDALRDAERQGREAMADIRQTVGLLGSAQGEVAPTPDLAELPHLVQGFRDAGLQVALDVKGDLAALPASTGLGLYRVAQESLTNVAKHQPSSRTRVTVDVRNGVRLAVVNDLQHPVRHASDDGAGIRGMAQRADLLGARFGAGPRGTEWVVELVVPGVRRHRLFGRSFACPVGLSEPADPSVADASLSRPTPETA